jgi:hypothetical protein
MYGLVGHNSNVFDAPFLLRRSWALGVKVNRNLLPQKRYWPDLWIDTMELWGSGVFGERISLDRMAKHFGLAGKNGDGSKFAELLKSDLEAAKEYCLNDIRLTRDIHERILKLQGDDHDYNTLTYFDIETGPLPDAEIERIAPEFNPAKVKTGAMGFEKAQEKVAQAQEGHLDGIKSKAALNAEYGQVLGIGYIMPDGEEVFKHGPEKELVSDFWKLAGMIHLGKPIKV